VATKHSVPKKRDDAESPAAFHPHAIIATERTVPSQIWLAALISVEKILRLDFDLSQPEDTYLAQALAQIPEHTIAFGRPIGVTINYAPKRAIRYDLKGNVVELLPEAVRCGQASTSIPPGEEDVSVDLGRVFGLR
jgi:hypothetical protein